jgi:hypothetical protein
VRQAPGQVVEVTATYSEAYPHFRVCEVSLCARLLIGDRVNRITYAAPKQETGQGAASCDAPWRASLERFDFE